MNLSNYPPGVTGNEPHLTGEHPCGHCGGFGVDFHGSETSVTVYRRDGTFKTFDNYDDAQASASAEDEIVVDEHPTGEACCVPCKGTGREPDSVVYGNEPEDTRTFYEVFQDEYPHGTQPHPESER